MFYGKSKKPTTVVLDKKDIRLIPFEELASSCLSAASHAVSLATQKAQEDRESLIASRFRQLSANEESSEGIEESLEEDTPEVSIDLRMIKTMAYKEACQEFCDKYTLKGRSSWLPAQLMALIANWKPVKVGDDYDPKATLSASIKLNDKWMMGAYLLMVYAKRGAFVDEQYKPSGINYCALVPFILAGFKKYHGIKYTEWSQGELDRLVEANLLEAMMIDPINITNEEILQEREVGLTVKSGKNLGSVRSAISTHALFCEKGSKLGSLPWLAQVMLAQIWCAYPSNREHSDYLILDPYNWDEVPEPLIPTRVLKKPVTVNYTDVNPWD